MLSLLMCMWTLLIDEYKIITDTVFFAVFHRGGFGGKKKKNAKMETMPIPNGRFDPR